MNNRTKIVKEKIKIKTHNKKSKIITIINMKKHNNNKQLYKHNRRKFRSQTSDNIDR